MGTQRYMMIALSAAAMLTAASLPGTVSATELPVPARIAAKPQATQAARPVVRAVRRPVRFVWHSYRPVRYVVSRPTVPVQYAALDQRRWPSWTHMVFLGVGF